MHLVEIRFSLKLALSNKQHNIDKKIFYILCMCEWWKVNIQNKSLTIRKKLHSDGCKDHNFNPIDLEKMSKFNLKIRPTDFLTEVILAPFPLFLGVSGSDWLPGGAADAKKIK